MNEECPRVRGTPHALDGCTGAANVARYWCATDTRTKNTSAKIHKQMENTMSTDLPTTLIFPQRHGMPVESKEQVHP